MKLADDARLSKLVTEQLAKRSITPDERLPAICALFKDRCETTQILADWASAFYTTPERNEADFAQHVTEAAKPAINALAAKLKTCEWNRAALAIAVKETLAETGLKMPQLAMPARVLLMGKAQTPSLDAVLALCGQKLSLERLIC
jgi:glutamyl-tRNA synthetase